MTSLDSFICCIYEFSAVSLSSLSSHCGQYIQAVDPSLTPLSWFTLCVFIHTATPGKQIPKFFNSDEHLYFTNEYFLTEITLLLMSADESL